MVVVVVVETEGCTVWVIVAVWVTGGRVGPGLSTVTVAYISVEGVSGPPSTWTTE